MNMDFCSNKTHVEVTKEGAFGGPYFRDSYHSSVNDKWCKRSLNEFYELKNIDQIIIVQIIMMLMLINMVLNAEYH